MENRKVQLAELIETPITGEWGNEIKDADNQNIVKVIRTTNFTNSGEIDYSDITLRDIEYTKCEKKKLKYGDIILEKSGGTDVNPVGRVVFFDKNDSNDVYLTNNFTTTLRVKDNKINSRFLLLFLLYNYKYKGVHKFYNKTTGIQNLQVSNLIKNIYVPLPEINIQSAIVEILDKIKNIIKRREKQIILFDELIKSRFIEMFGDPIKNDKGWKKEKLLENVVEKVENISKNSEIIISYIDISSINNLKNRIETYKNYYIDEAPSRAKKIINRNDILISTVRPNLKNIALFDIETENKAIASTGFCILRTKTKLNTLYLFNVLLSNSFTNELSKKEIGANYPAVTENDIKNVKIALPPLTLQNEFAEFVTKTDKLKFRLFSLIILGENLLKNLTLLIFLDNIRLVLELDKRNKNKN